jgi:hypothetical protein
MTRGHGWSLTITMRGTFTPLLFAGFYRRFRFDPIFFGVFIWFQGSITDVKMSHCLQKKGVGG